MNDVWVNHEWDNWGGGGRLSAIELNFFTKDDRCDKKHKQSKQSLLIKVNYNKNVILNKGALIEFILFQNLDNLKENELK